MGYNLYNTETEGFTLLSYNSLSKELIEEITADRKLHKTNPYCFEDSSVIRRKPSDHENLLWRPSFVQDCEKILHLPLYNRYADKTQVFSFYNNDDLSRRAIHVQLVSRIARNIGTVLGLNTDLIEASALGHDIGHTPLGHAGERYLNELLHNEMGMCFNHNVQSARVLDTVFKRNISLQTLDAALCHNGEFEMKEYRPCKMSDFSEFDAKMKDCIENGEAAIKKLIPCTLEGCVVRICDMIAYLGKDRQDARRAKITDEKTMYSNSEIGTENAAMINNLVVDIIENSYGKDYIMLSSAAFEGLKTAKRENYAIIYNNPETSAIFDATIKPMFKDLYYALLDQLKNKDENSVIYKHHIDFVREQTKYYGKFDYLLQNEHLIVCDFIASMTDDYFVALHKKLFPDSEHIIEYKSYFENN